MYTEIVYRRGYLKNSRCWDCERRMESSWVLKRFLGFSRNFFFDSPIGLRRQTRRSCGRCRRPPTRCRPARWARQPRLMESWSSPADDVIPSSRMNREHYDLERLEKPTTQVGAGATIDTTIRQRVDSDKTFLEVVSLHFNSMSKGSLMLVFTKSRSLRRLSGPPEAVGQRFFSHDQFLPSAREKARFLSILDTIIQGMKKKRPY